MINITRDIRSISDFKRKTPDILRQLKHTGQPVVLTMNGRAEVVVQDAESYQQMVEIIERVRDIDAIRNGLEDVAAGNTMSLDSFIGSMKRKHKALRK